MKKLLLYSSLTGLLLPTLAFAAANDVALTTEVDLSVNSITLDISGATTAIESITVDSTSFSITLPSGSTFEVTALGLNRMVADNTLWQTASTTCTGSSSVLGYNNQSGDSITVTVTPSSTLCADAAAATSSSRGDSRGGGGGAVARAVVVPGVVATTPAPIVTTANPSRVTLTANLSTGSRGNDVKGLQQFLNTHGFPVAASGPGSPGNETTIYGNLTVQAIQKFQKQYGIVSSGTPSTTGYGRVGPKTRAKINELSK